MTKFSSSRRFYGGIIFGVLLVLAIIATILVAVFAEDINPGSIKFAFSFLGSLIGALIIAFIVYRFFKARPDLLYKDPKERRFRSPYASVESDSYQYKPGANSGKKPFTDFSLNEKTTCFICKLEIAKNEKIYRCPDCKAPFHMNHLTEWLNENSDCPVCNIQLEL
ncbi:MAG: hypothetical protein KGD59_05985 [Candidatus Heimdallarchaeota archaeon]|nr:hypothetical protein [Candidatus Heimdallarchaeota archaeon]MBY8994082.1 hypothetical protein [Candidatus Heimdallarchaeota archaeon]